MKLMKRLQVVVALILISLSCGCSRKAAPTDPPPPEVLVTTVTPEDVPRVLERVATLDGFINANINAQVQGYIVARDYTEGSIVKIGDLLFQIDPRPFEAALAQARGTLARDKANQVKADADEKRALDLFTKQVISDQERDTATAAAESTRANVEADEAAVQQAQLNLGYTKILAPIEGVSRVREQSGRRPCWPKHWTAHHGFTNRSDQSHRHRRRRRLHRFRFTTSRSKGAQRVYQKP